MNVDEKELAIVKACFHDPDFRSECYGEIGDNEVFKDEVVTLLWHLYASISDSGHEITKASLKGWLEETKNHELIPFVEEEIFSPAEAEPPRYELSVIIEENNKKILYKVAKQVMDDFVERPSNEVLRMALDNLSQVHVEGTKIRSFDNAFDDTLLEMEKIHRGEMPSYYPTCFPILDEILALSPRRTILLASAKKIGKTRFVTKLIDGLIENNPGQVAVQWNSFEMKAEELIRMFMSRRVKLTDREMLSKNFTLSEDDMINIRNTKNDFKDYPIDIVDVPTDIFNITNKFSAFTKKHKGKLPVLIVDNIGLIDHHIDHETQFFNDIARKFKNVRDTNDALVILLHHLTKEQESEKNRGNKFEPTLNHVRETSRLLDYANQCVLLHRFDHYKILREEAKFNETNISGKFLVKVPMNRDGEIGDVLMQHELKYSDFHEVHRVDE